jgi:hypothetical protein
MRPKHRAGLRARAMLASLLESAESDTKRVVLKLTCSGVAFFDESGRKAADSHCEADLCRISSVKAYMETNALG